MKTAFITGGSSGLGLEMARNLAAQGYHSLIMARNQSRIDEAVKSIREQGGLADGFAGDISDSRTLENLTKELKESVGKIDFLILNAGVVHVKLLSDYDNLEEMKQDIEVDLWGTMLTAYYMLPLMEAGSRVLIVSSIAGLDGVAGYSTYCSAKAGVMAFGKALRRELFCRKISVYMACPADLDTPQYQQEFASMPNWMKEQNTLRPTLLSAEKAAKRILKKCSGKRFLIFSDFTSHILLLMSRFLPLRLWTFIVDTMFPYPKES